MRSMGILLYHMEHSSHQNKLQTTPYFVWQNMMQKQRNSFMHPIKFCTSLGRNKSNDIRHRQVCSTKVSSIKMQSSGGVPSANVASLSLMGQLEVHCAVTHSTFCNTDDSSEINGLFFRFPDGNICAILIWGHSSYLLSNFFLVTIFNLLLSLLTRCDFWFPNKIKVSVIFCERGAASG